MPLGQGLENIMFHGWKSNDVSCKISAFRHQEHGLTLSRELLNNTCWCHAYKCWNPVLDCGQWLASLLTPPLTNVTASVVWRHVKGATCSCGEEILTRRERSSLTDFNDWINGINKLTFKDNTISYCFALFIFGGPCHLSNFKQCTIFSSQTSVFIQEKMNIWLGIITSLVM